MFSVLFVIVDQIINKSSTYLFSENNFNRLVLTATNLLKQPLLLARTAETHLFTMEENSERNYK